MRWCFWRYQVENKNIYCFKSFTQCWQYWQKVTQMCFSEERIVNLKWDGSWSRRWRRRKRFPKSWRGWVFLTSWGLNHTLTFNKMPCCPHSSDNQIWGNYFQGCRDLRTDSILCNIFYNKIKSFWGTTSIFLLSGLSRLENGSGRPAQEADGGFWDPIQANHHSGWTVKKSKTETKTYNTWFVSRF